MKDLSKDEMKKVLGGVMAPPPNQPCSTQYELVCTTPNGSESWCRTSESGNASDECRAIYPAYGDSVWGNWGVPITV